MCVRVRVRACPRICNNQPLSSRMHVSSAKGCRFFQLVLTALERCLRVNVCLKVKVRVSYLFRMAGVKGPNARVASIHLDFLRAS